MVFESKPGETHKAEDIVDITGPKDQSLFYELKGWLLKGHTDGIQPYLNKTWDYYKDIADDRLLALVAALCIEASIEELLLAIGPGFDQMDDETDFTFSIKIKTLKALNLIPSRIITTCDFIRKIRNEFAHNLEYNNFAQLDTTKYLNKLLPYVVAFNSQKRNENDYKKLFEELVGFAIIALHLYKIQVSQMRKYIESVEGRKAFKDWAEKQILT